jgi:predicted house-cleaning noncanonical NTP pyrophosphatase (MazG superfamily)
MPKPITLNQLDTDNCHTLLRQAVCVLNECAAKCIKDLSFSPDPKNQLQYNIKEYIETGSDNDLALVILYLAKLQGDRQFEQEQEEENELNNQRETKVRDEAEEDRHYMFLRENHSVEALH